MVFPLHCTITALSRVSVKIILLIAAKFRRWVFGFSYFLRLSPTPRFFKRSYALHFRALSLACRFLLSSSLYFLWRHTNEILGEPNQRQQFKETHHTARCCVSRRIVHWQVFILNWFPFFFSFFCRLWNELFFVLQVITESPCFYLEAPIFVYLTLSSHSLEGDSRSASQ